MHPFYVALIGAGVIAVTLFVMINVLEYYEKKHQDAKKTVKV